MMIAGLPPPRAACLLLFLGQASPVRNLSLLPRSRYVPAVVGGVLLACSFPKIGVAGLAWVAPALILGAALGKTGGESFRLGYVAGAVHYLASLYWLLAIPYCWHGIPLGPAVGWLALASFLAIFPATWVWILSSRALPSETSGIFARSWLRRHLWMLSGAALWVGLEMVITRIFSGFPWNLLGASQYQLLPLIQIASLTGIYGVSFLVIWTSLSLLSAALMLVRRPGRRSAAWGEILLPALVVAFVFNFGLRRLAHDSNSERTLNVTFVQPSIPQTLIWDSRQDDARFRELLDLSERALTNRTDLLLWPEAAVPKLLRYDETIFQAVTQLAKTNRVWMIIGADDAERRLDATAPDDADYFNSSFLISPQGELVNRYRKRNLVIFGEYIPLVRWLPFLEFFTPIQGGFTSGPRAVPFQLTDPAVKTSVLICFEDIFPELGRESAEDDTDFLVNLTNNGWFGEGGAQWQHGTSGLFRAVENDIPLLRCCNNGLTCWVDGRGRLRKIFRDHRGTIYGPGVMTAEIPLLPAGKPRTPTFYHVHGDWLGWSCTALSAALLLAAFASRFRGRKAAPAN
jgi:apolipoprotein N-acyltransferase